MRRKQEKRLGQLETRTQTRRSASPLLRVRAPFLSPFLIPPYSRRLRCLEVGNHCLSDPSADIPLVLVAPTPLAFFSPFFLRLLSSFRISRSREIRRLRLLNFIVPLFERDVALPRSSCSPSSLVNSQPLALFSRAGCRGGETSKISSRAIKATGSPLLSQRRPCVSSFFFPQLSIGP